MNAKYSLPSWTYTRQPFQWRVNRLAYFATVTVVTLFVFSLAYVYIEEPPFWKPGQPGPPPRDLDAHIVVSPNSKSNLESLPALPSLPRPKQPPSTGKSSSGEDLVSTLSTTQKPKGLRVVGVIFYGRRDRSSILECYLRQNLVSSGGWLDEVIWAANTDDVDDLAWLNRVANASNGEYKVVRMEEKGYGNVYEASFTERNAIYVKIDDDVVYIEPQAIAKAVTTLISNPHALMISANVINSPALGWWHYHTDAAQSFKPELQPNQTALATRGNGMWKNSDLPTWTGDWTHDYSKFENFANFFDVESPEDIPKHRWLPTRNETDEDMYTSSIAATDANGGPHLTNWQIGAQNHYSFFSNLENGELGKYFLSKDYGKGTIWHMRGRRLSINFIVMQGADVLDYMHMITGHPHGDDEHQLTVEMPHVLQRPVLVESQSIVSHFSYGPQVYLHKTDIMERYFNYANDNVCPRHSLIDPMNPERIWDATTSPSSSAASSPSFSSSPSPTPVASRFFVRKSREGVKHLVEDKA
ncbi:hypothetical protein UA08_01796 [Talaromyces atroroseus]|uniref:Uncharacterized protein n=1 Tax=Talaromyces atroroseus TaxID=1441469 RepID=A0A1Q5QCF7_TALAT|nr:hypothetical protein UA08_01796 [Talaromyces atroroseus]OKL63469.1 hypothetical protein UA08_01796 [Talaromyces atroroseus]